MHPPNLRTSLVVIAGEIPNSCALCRHFADGMCLKFSQEVSIKEVCDAYEVSY